MILKLKKMVAKRLKRNIGFIHALATARKPKRAKIIEMANIDLMKCLLDCAANVLEGNIPLSEKQFNCLKKYKYEIYQLADKSQPMHYKKELLIQNGGFLPSLLLPILSVAASLITDSVLNKNA